MGALARILCLSDSKGIQEISKLLGLKAKLLVALDLEQTFWRTFLANAPLFPRVVDTLSLLRDNQILL